MQLGQNNSVHWEAHGQDWPALERSSVVAVVVVSVTGRIMAANALLANLLRMGAAGDLIGRSMQDLLVDSGEWTQWLRAIRGGLSTGISLRLRRSDSAAVVMLGDISMIPDRSGQLQCLGIFVDKSEEQHLREAMQRSARLEALGSLTSGVAHDFNNLLTVLVGNLSLVAEELRNQPELFAKIKSARDAANRGADLIRQLLAFARHQPVEAKLIKPSQVISNLIPLLERALGTKVKLKTNLESETGTVRGNVAQFESVIVNLAVNARDALETTGEVVIATIDLDLRATDADRLGLPKGQYVQISVTDDGSGIPASAVGKVFEPFFSTKGDRGGTGLGLAMVRTYATQFAGAARIESVQGEGTSVILLFPRTSDSLDETSAKTMPLSTLPSGDESILLLAREEGVRATVGQILEVLGYEVMMCTDQTQAATVLSERQFDLVIIDGMEAIVAAAKASQSAGIASYKFLQLTSMDDGQGAVCGDNSRTLTKPFSLADLAQSVRAALDSQA